MRAMLLVDSAGDLNPLYVSFLFKVEILVLETRLELNALDGKECEAFWSTGVLECLKNLNPEFQLELVSSFLHYSTTPSLRQTSA